MPVFVCSCVSEYSLKAIRFCYVWPAIRAAPTSLGLSSPKEIILLLLNTHFSLIVIVKNKTNTNQRRFRKRQNQNFVLSRRTMPPSIPSNVQVTHTFRFQGDVTGYDIVTYGDLFRLAGSVATAATSIRPIYTSLRLNSVELWATNTLGSSSCSLRWTTTGAYGNVDKEITDSSLSTAYPSHLIARPPREAYQAAWYTLVSANSLEAFQYQGVGALLMDINLSLIIQDNQPTGTGTQAVTGATIGAIYYPTFNTGMLPIGLTNIA